MYVGAQDAADRGLEPDDFVEEMKKQGIRVPGIGHRIKSKVSMFPMYKENPHLQEREC